MYCIKKDGEKIFAIQDKNVANAYKISKQRINLLPYRQRSNAYKLLVSFMEELLIQERANH